MPVQHRADLFGVPLEDIMGFDGEKGGVPRVIRDAIQYLRETGGLNIMQEGCSANLRSSLGLLD